MGVKSLAKIKIHEIAKELGLESKEVLAKAQELGIGVTSHMSAVDDEQAEKIRGSLKNEEARTTKQETVKEKSKKDKSDKVNKEGENDKKKTEKETPVIIRREVIRTDLEEKEEKQNKQQNKRSDVGCVERRKNQDYNIVYRKQPVKPMTVSELFGLKTPKKEEKKEEPKAEAVEEKNVKPEIENATTKSEKTEVNQIAENAKKDQKVEGTVTEKKSSISTSNHATHTPNRDAFLMRTGAGGVFRTNVNERS